MQYSVSVLVLAAITSCGSDERRPAVHTTPSVARLVSMSGDVRIRRAGTTAWTPVERIAELHSDDMIQTLGTGSVVLRVTETGGELAMAPGTTMRFDASPRPHAVNGKLVARTSVDPTRTASLEVVTPPGVVVLGAPIGGPPASAAIEVDGPTATIELLSGAGAFHHDDRVVSLERRAGRFGAPPTTPPTAVVELHRPAEGASLRVRQQVQIDWKPVVGADRYEIELTSGAVVRRIEVDAPPAPISLSSGDYTWCIHAHRGDQIIATASPRTLHVIVDNRAPLLEVSSPRDGAIIRGEQLEVTGTTEPGAVVEVARTSRVADPQGRFALRVPIQRGLANIVISVRDDLGNARRVSRSVVCE